MPSAPAPYRAGMCGRYVLTTPGEVLAQIFETAPPPEETLAAIVPRYNIAPTQTVPIIRRSSTAAATRELAMVQWGLVPHWAKDPGIGNSLINARSETAAEKPSFRDAMKRRRCLIPANAFYEWKKLGKGKQPFLIQLRGGSTFAFAILALVLPSLPAWAACTMNIVGNTLKIDGCNVQITNGTGSSTTVNGLGNLIIGYNPANTEPGFPTAKTGSHNLVVGDEHSYTSSVACRSRRRSWPGSL